MGLEKTAAARSLTAVRRFTSSWQQLAARARAAGGPAKCLKRAGPGDFRHQDTDPDPRGHSGKRNPPSASAGLLGRGGQVLGEGVDCPPMWAGGHRSEAEGSGSSKPLPARGGRVSRLSEQRGCPYGHRCPLSPVASAPGKIAPCHALPHRPHCGQGLPHSFGRTGHLPGPSGALSGSGCVCLAQRLQPSHVSLGLLDS